MYKMVLKSILKQNAKYFRQVCDKDRLVLLVSNDFLGTPFGNLTTPASSAPSMFGGSGFGTTTTKPTTGT